MRKALTAKTIEAFKPREKRCEIHDTLCPGLSLRVTQVGTKTFTLKYRYGLKQRRLKLGVYPRLTLAEAREKAIEALRLVDDGLDPAARQRDLSRRVDAVVDDFIKHYAKPRNRSWKSAERLLRNELVARHGVRNIDTINRADILDIMDGAIARGATYQANRIHSQLRKFFNWCVERGIVEVSPVGGIKAPTREQSRDRLLNDAELTSLISICSAEPYPFGSYILLLLLTAQRRSEVADMRWSEIDLDNREWVIPAQRCKNGKPHHVPLSSYAASILQNLPRMVGCDYVFTTTGRTPISGFSKSLKRLQERSDTSGWRYHDLRRTAASGMARAGVLPHVIEKVLNHTSGTISGVAAVYNRFGYDEEKREALEEWGRRLSQQTNRSQNPKAQ